MTSLTNYLEEEANAIAYAAGRLSSEHVENALTLINDCFKRRAKLIITGVGKSGIVCRKIAATFTSIGITGLYLNPLDALHGDIGIVSSYDVTILISNSGETEELIDIIPHLKVRGTKLIALVGNINSTIAKSSDVILDGSVNKESCPLNIIPTASTAVAMAIGDALAAVLMERQGISSEDFAFNHPAGALGKQLTVRVLDLMIKDELNPCLFKESNLEDIITNITQNGIGATAICETKNTNKLIGIITDGDIRRAFEKFPCSKWDKLLAKDIMSEDPIIIYSDVFAIEALQKMEHNRKKSIHVMPVLDRKDNFVGFIRLHDLIKAGLSAK